MINITREEKLFLAIGGVDERLVDQAADPRKAPQKRPARGRWAAIAAAFVLVAGVGIVRLLPLGGSGAGGMGIRPNDAQPGGAAFMSYAGPVLPLTVIDGPEGLPAEREITWGFLGTADATKYSLYRAEVTDTTTIRNPEGQTLTVTIGYPVTADLRSDEELFPTLTVNGETLETTLLWGDTGAVRDIWPQWDPRLEGWEAVKSLLEDGSYLAGSREEPPALDYTVTVWEFLDETTPDVNGKNMAPTLAVDFRLDQEKTKVYPWGFNGYSMMDDGTVRYDFFVRQGGEPQQRRLLVFLGEAPAEYVMGGYENGGCEKPLEGVSARVTAFTTTLGELLDQLSDEALATWYWDGAEDAEGRGETIKAAARQMMARFAPAQPGEGGFFMLEDLFSHTLTVSRVVWATAEVTIPAGGEITVTARYQKEASYDFACAHTSRQGLRGWDLGTTLGSNLRFEKIIARLENTARLALEGQNFGFDLPGGVTRVELDPAEPYYYMEVRLKEG